MTAEELQAGLQSVADPEIAVVSARFFKTGPGRAVPRIVLGSRSIVHREVVEKSPSEFGGR